MNPVDLFRSILPACAACWLVALTPAQSRTVLPLGADSSEQPSSLALPGLGYDGWM